MQSDHVLLSFDLVSSDLRSAHMQIPGYDMVWTLEHSQPGREVAQPL